MKLLWLAFLSVWTVAASVAAQDLGELAIEQVYREALTPHRPFSGMSSQEMFPPVGNTQSTAPLSFPYQGLYAPPMSPRGLLYQDMFFGPNGEINGFIYPPTPSGVFQRPTVR